MAIKFLAADPYFAPEALIRFRVSLDNKEIECTISDDALKELSGVYSNNPMPTFNANLGRITQITEKLIEENRFENEMIIVKSLDVQRFRNL